MSENFAPAARKYQIFYSVGQFQHMAYLTFRQILKYKLYENVFMTNILNHLFILYLTPDASLDIRKISIETQVLYLRRGNNACVMGVTKSDTLLRDNILCLTFVNLNV